MCGQSSTASDKQQNQDFANQYHKAADMRLDDYFFLDPIFIIAMLVLVVIIVIIVSWWLQRRELALAAKEAEANDVEKDREPKTRNGEISDKNLDVLEGLLNTIGTEDGNETEALLSNGNGEKFGKHTSFGPITKLHDGCNSESATEGEENEKDAEEKTDPDKIITIIPDKDFRDFPKTEEDMMKMRRANMKKMLALPPLS